MCRIKEVLGLWIESNEGAKFWLRVVTELKNRGVEDMRITCCDGLKGFPDAIESVFPNPTVQWCIVHMIRNSLKYVSFKDRRALAADLKPIFRARTRQAAEDALAEFENKHGDDYPMVVESWKNNWERVVAFVAFVAFLDFPEDIRRAIYTTNAIESLNSSLRKAIRAHGHFPNDTAATKLLYLALTKAQKKAQKKWAMPIGNWGRALNQLAIPFEGRLPL